ncbi:unnamed protein product [Phyllotreta striolata]|uniref:C-type lectin domain-containing protein n=1 Tax=Phyllotreta striolata TaxID=444603 RepID=A0A9N9TQD0_PHYSR|nr:unnamed protein product [Phyllotreta striolata]
MHDDNFITYLNIFECFSLTLDKLCYFIYKYRTPSERIVILFRIRQLKMHYSLLVILVCVGYAAAKAVETDVRPLHSFKANEKTYYILPDQKSFLQGDIECAAYNYTLVKIENQAENDAIVAQLTKFDNAGAYWTGGTKGYGQVWYWFTTAEEISNTNWAPNEPDSEHTLYNCIAIDLSKHSDGKWMGNLCGDHKYTICQK